MTPASQRSDSFTPAYGFTLAELLIALAIMGLIAAFSIPAMFSNNGSQSGTQSKMANDVALMLFNARKQYLIANSTLPTNTTIGAFTPYMNYVSVATSGQLDDHLNANYAYDCASNVVCLKLHNGGTFFYSSTLSFGGSNTTNGIYVLFDPDGARTGVSTDDPGKAVCFFIYYDGTIKTRGNTIAGTRTSNATTYNPGSYDPSWFGGL